MTPPPPAEIRMASKGRDTAFMKHSLLDVPSSAPGMSVGPPDRMFQLSRVTETCSQNARDYCSCVCACHFMQNKPYMHSSSSPCASFLKYSKAHGVRISRTADVMNSEGSRCERVGGVAAISTDSAHEALLRIPNTSVAQSQPSANLCCESSISNKEINTFNPTEI